MEFSAVFQRGASVLHSNSSRWLHPLSFSLPVFMSRFQLYIRGVRAKSHPREAKWHPTPPLPLLFPRIFRMFSPAVLRLFSRRSLSSPRWDSKNSTGLTENNIPGKRAEGVIIPTKRSPAAQTEFVGRWALLKFRSSTFPGLLEALRICRISWISTSQPACMRVSDPRALLTPVWAPPLQYRLGRIKKKKKKLKQIINENEITSAQSVSLN